MMMMTHSNRGKNTMVNSGWYLCGCSLYQFFLLLRPMDIFVMKIEPLRQHFIPMAEVVNDTMCE